MDTESVASTQRVDDHDSACTAPEGVGQAVDREVT